MPQYPDLVSADRAKKYYGIVVKPPASAPTSVTQPHASGTATVGSQLSCSAGTWTHEPTSYAYQWTRGGVNIAGATSPQYTLVALDSGTSVACKVTATNAAGSNTATSNVIAVA